MRWIAILFLLVLGGLAIAATVPGESLLTASGGISLSSGHYKIGRASCRERVSDYV